MQGIHMDFLAKQDGYGAKQLQQTDQHGTLAVSTNKKDIQ